jgi:hypothetical protein
MPQNLVTFPDWLYSIPVTLQRNQLQSPEASGKGWIVACQRNPGGVVVKYCSATRGSHF